MLAKAFTEKPLLDNVDRKEKKHISWGKQQVRLILFFLLLNKVSKDRSALQTKYKRAEHVRGQTVL